MGEGSSATSVLSVRVNPEERAVLEAAAAQSHTNLSDFVRRKAIEAAEMDVLGRSVVTIPAAQWERFEEWLARPPATIVNLKELARLVPTWSR